MVCSVSVGIGAELSHSYFDVCHRAVFRVKHGALHSGSLLGVVEVVEREMFYLSHILVSVSLGHARFYP